MASKYFICARPQANESHAVHKEDCPYLPEPGERIFLGVFQFPHEAIEEGIKYFCMPDGCRFCSKEYYIEGTKDLFFEEPDKLNFLTSDKLRDTWESVFICSIN